VVFVCFASALSTAALFVDPDELAAAILATAIFVVHAILSLVLELLADWGRQSRKIMRLVQGLAQNAARAARWGRIQRLFVAAPRTWVPASKPHP
jgi:hypothetical protein